MKSVGLFSGRTNGVEPGLLPGYRLASDPAVSDVDRRRFAKSHSSSESVE